MGLFLSDAAIALKPPHTISDFPPERAASVRRFHGKILTRLATCPGGIAILSV